MSIGQMLRQWLIRIEYVLFIFLFLIKSFLLRWYDTLFPRIPVPTQKDITEKLHAHGPYKGDNFGAHSRYVRWKVSKNDNIISIISLSFMSFFFYLIYYSYGYDEYEEEEQYQTKSSNAIDMPETFGNVASSSSDSYRDKKYR